MIYFPFFCCLVLGLFFLIASYSIFEYSKHQTGLLRDTYDTCIAIAIIVGFILLVVSAVYWHQVIMPILKAGG